MIRSSKNKSTMSSPKGMKTAALRIFWWPHFDINRKVTAVSLLTMETKSTRAFWGGAKAESFLREGSTSLRNCSCIPSVWEQTSTGKCYIHCICCIMAWTCKATCPPASFLCQSQKVGSRKWEFLPMKLTPWAGNKHSRKSGKKTEPIKKFLDFSCSRGIALKLIH